MSNSTMNSISCSKVIFASNYPFLQSLFYTQAQALIQPWTKIMEGDEILVNNQKGAEHTDHKDKLVETPTLTKFINAYTE